MADVDAARTSQALAGPAPLLGARWREDQERRGRELGVALGLSGVDGVALTYVDNAGVTRMKAVPVSQLGHAAGWGAGMSPQTSTNGVVARRSGAIWRHPSPDTLTA